MNEIDKQADTAIKDLQCNEGSKQGVFTDSGTAACNFGDFPDHHHDEYKIQIELSGL